MKLNTAIATTAISRTANVPERRAHERPDVDHAPLVGIVIVNFQCLAQTELCLRSLAALDYPRFFVIVVNNGSDSQSAEALRALAEQTRMTTICVPENRGFAAACNIGIHQALASSAEYVWVLNPDTIVDSRALAELVATAQQEGVAGSAPAVVGSKVLYGPADVEEVRSASQQTGQLSEYRRIWGIGGEIRREQTEVDMRGWNETDNGQFDEIQTCDYVPGCSMLIPASAFSSVGYFDERYFLYFEETDWCVRAAQRGVRLLCTPRSVVWHCFDDAKLQGPLAVYYYNRNRLQFWYRLSAFRHRVAMLTKVFFRDLPEAKRALAQASDVGTRRVLYAHVLAYQDFLRGRRGSRLSGVFG